MTGHLDEDGNVIYQLGPKDKGLLGVFGLMATIATVVSIWTQVSITREDSGQNVTLSEHNTRLEQLEASSRRWDDTSTKLERIDERTIRTAADVQEILRKIRGAP